MTDTITIELPTLTQSKVARKMLRASVPISRVIGHLGNKFDEATIKAGIEHLRVHQRAERSGTHRWKGMVDFHQVKNITKGEKAGQQHRASLQPRDTTAFLMGDPLPGYSMAERAPSIVPIRRRDPLDALIFKPRAGQLLERVER